MSKTAMTVTRKTKETDISLTIDMDNPGSLEIETGLPFFDHMLHAMAFHGGFGLSLSASGDTEVDPHHLVEDVGLVLGSALDQLRTGGGSFHRFGHAIIPMDDALSEVTIDACGRPYLSLHASFPQPRAGDFDLSLIREYLLALANTGLLNLHAECRYGENGHHMAESLFKALGKALKEAYTRIDGHVRSTKGVL